ncbi:MAG: IS200/IS605 family transposase [Chloroflexota bacterium]
MSFWRTYYHIVWGTKNREPFITQEIEAELYRYIVFKAHEIEIRIHALNGWTDHVHLVGSIPPKLSVADGVRRLKGASSNFMRTSHFQHQTFEWARGYGVFTLGESQREFAEAYVNQQKEHHAKQTTNQWLEYTQAADEGPPDDGLSSDEVFDQLKRSVREDGPIYQITFDDPFPL